jgi:hypothetical protein
MSEMCQVCGQPLETDEKKDMGVHINYSINIVHDTFNDDSQLY